MINAYGSSETTVCASMGVFQDGDTRLHIGQPLPNVQVYVLNEHGSLVPPGAAGELYIGGAGVGRGYLNCSKLTAEKFIANPFHDAHNPASSERLYRTGDLVRWLPDGNLAFLGRVDHQAKIRSFRIELGKIENALIGHPQVDDAVVMAKGSDGDRRLVAYVAGQGGSALIDELRQHLGQSLPGYMVPAVFVVLDCLPLTPNGKVDRKALPEPDIDALQASYVAPRTVTEQDVLGLERVSVTDNFFHLRGHSLLIMQVISRLQQQNMSVSARQLFTTPTVAELALIIGGSKQSAMRAFQESPKLIAAGSTAITPDMLTLVDLNEVEIATVISRVPGGAANVQDIYPLAPPQEGILFHHMMNAGGDPYVLPALFRIKELSAVHQFIDALQFVFNHHDVLRSAILWKDLPFAVQVVCRGMTLPVSWLTLGEGDAEAQMLARCTPQYQHMDLSRAPLLQMQIAKGVQFDQHYVLLQLHHVISDHVGLDIIQKEVAAFLAGEAGTLAAPVPYREFIAHVQHQALHHDAEAFFTRCWALLKSRPRHMACWRSMATVTVLSRRKRPFRVRLQRISAQLPGT